MEKKTYNTVENLTFLMYTYEFIRGNDGSSLINKVKDTEKFVVISKKVRHNEMEVAKILINSDVLPHDDSCEYLVDSQNPNAIYVNKDGMPFCEFREIVVH